MLSIVLVSVTTFGIVQSDLWYCLDEYDIVRDDAISTVEWHTKDGRNTLEVRLDRQKRLIDAAAEFGITTLTTDQDIEKLPPFAAYDFLKAYSQKVHEQGGASETERSMMNERKRTIRREVRRIQAKNFLSRVGLLEQALWIKRKFS